MEDFSGGTEIKNKERASKTEVSVLLETTVYTSRKRVRIFGVTEGKRKSNYRSVEFSNSIGISKNSRRIVRPFLSTTDTENRKTG